MESQLATLRTRCTALETELEAARGGCSAHAAPELLRARSLPPPAPGSQPPSPVTDGALIRGLLRDGADADGAPAAASASGAGAPPRVLRSSAFSGHTSPITCCRYAPDGGSVASASSDGTVRIWTPRASSASAAPLQSAGRGRSATLHCGAPVCALDWEPRLGRLVLLGTQQGGVRAWDAEAQRVVSQAGPLADAAAHPIHALAASPCGTAFATATEAGVMLWSLRSFAPSAALPLPTASPPAVRALAYNHNGKLLAAACGDGCLRLYDTAARAQIMCWKAHHGAGAAALQFGAHQTTLMSLGCDGEVSEWGLRAGESLRRAHLGDLLCCSGECEPLGEAPRPRRFQLALQSEGRWALACSGRGCAALLDLSASDFAAQTLSDRQDDVTSVDWHPARSVALTGGADAQVRTTQLAE